VQDPRLRAIDPEERLPAAVEATAYFVVAEALTNVSKYAQATSTAIAVARRNGSLFVDVIDDGVGGATPGAGSGLLGLEDRVAALGGTLAVESPAGAGTHLHAEIPCA
jgi:signal transduction histidine kinase